MLSLWHCVHQWHRKYETERKQRKEEIREVGQDERKGHKKEKTKYENINNDLKVE
jgi:hypothetical protein